jgi:hypothetical protein
VHVKGCELQLPDLEYEIVPVYTVKTWYECKTKNGSKVTVSREQVPLVPAYSYTDYKSQGQTLKRAIVDLASARTTQSVYVMLSWVKTLDGLLILRDFPEAKLKMSISGDLQEEFARIDQLDKQTQIWYKQNFGPSVSTTRSSTSIA